MTGSRVVGAFCLSFLSNHRAFPQQLRHFAFCISTDSARASSLALRALFQQDSSGPSDQIGHLEAELGSTFHHAG